MRGNSNPNKAKNPKASLLKLFKYCKKYLPVIIIALVFSIASTLAALWGPGKVGDIANLISDGMFSPEGIDLEKITKLGIFLVCLYVFVGVFWYFENFLMVQFSQKISKNLRTDISKKINRLPLKFLDSTPTGDVLSRVTNDIDLISSSLNNTVSSFISAVILLIGSIVMMFVTNWIMAFAAIGSSIIGFGIMAVIMAKSQKYFMAQQAELGKLNGYVEENYSGLSIVRAYGNKEKAIEEFSEINKKLHKNAWKSQFLSGLMMPLMTFIGNLGYVVVCVVGAVLVAQGKMGFGVIVSFIIYVRLFSNTLTDFAQIASYVQSMSAASERVFEFLDEKELEVESPRKKKLRKVKGDVEFKNVCFGYDKDKTIIHDFSAKVKAGQKVAIVGPTGAGKTTLVNLLMRFYEIDSGEILIDGVSTKKLSRGTVHSLFSMVLQDTWVFDGTVKENIVYSKENVSNEEVIAACKAIDFDHFVRTLPKGYETVLDNQTTISAGQKQLLTIARAMIQDCPMLILDEATSNVDTRTEIQIQKAMDKLSHGRTSFVIAHRLSTIKNANLILVMKDGNIIESGTHKNLMKKGGFYKELYESQFSRKNSEVIDN